MRRYYLKRFFSLLFMVYMHKYINKGISDLFCIQFGFMIQNDFNLVVCTENKLYKTIALSIIDIDSWMVCMEVTTITQQFELATSIDHKKHSHTHTHTCFSARVIFILQFFFFVPRWNSHNFLLNMISDIWPLFCREYISNAYFFHHFTRNIKKKKFKLQNSLRRAKRLFHCVDYRLNFRIQATITLGTPKQPTMWNYATSARHPIPFLFSIWKNKFERRGKKNNIWKLYCLVVI